jgi:diaminopimelate decarboxylase
MPAGDRQPALALFPPAAEVVDDDLLVGGCSLRGVAEQFGTAVLVVDEGGLRAHARRYLAAFTERHARSRVFFATKAFPSVSVIRVLADEGLGSDVVGGGELAFALAAGADPASILMHGNAKSDDDLTAALDAGIGYVVVDGFDDIDRLARLAAAPVPVLIRVSPGVDSATHPALATGGAGSKFGIPLERVPDAIRRIRAESMIELRGLHVHIGSGITALDQFGDAVETISRLERFGVYDFGGGLGVPYVPSDPAPSLEQYADAVVGAAHRHLGADIELIVEPGRSMVAPFGVTLYRVVTIKRGPRVHVAVDGGMGDNLEHSLYGQRFAPVVVGRWDEPLETVDLVGRHCEEGDVLVRDAALVAAQIGDLVAVPVTGAYCFTMANTYNASPRIPVVFVRDGVARLAVRRDTMADLLAREMPV